MPFDYKRRKLFDCHAGEHNKTSATAHGPAFRSAGAIADECVSGCLTSDDATARDEANNQHDHGKDEQKMNQPAAEAGRQSENPQQ